MSAFEQDPLRLRYQRHERELCRRSRERLVIEEDRLDVRMAGDHVVVEGRRVEDGRQAVHGGEGVGEEPGREGVEALDDRRLEQGGRRRHPEAPLGSVVQSPGSTVDQPPSTTRFAPVT